MTAAVAWPMQVADQGGVGGIQIGLSGALVAALATIAVALLTLAGVIYSSRQSRSAQDKSTEVEERRQRHLELVDYADRIERELAEAKAANAAQRVEHDRREQAQARRCDTALTSAMDAVHLLQRVVADEIAAEAGQDALDDARRHRTTDHPEPEE